MGTPNPAGDAVAAPSTSDRELEDAVKELTHAFHDYEVTASKDVDRDERAFAYDRFENARVSFWSLIRSREEKLRKETAAAPSTEPKMSDFTPNDAFGLLRSYSRHIRYVGLAIHAVADALERRAMVHDTSKMMDDEFSGFARINAAARVNKFGSPEYKEGMKRERGTIDLHFSRNTHHAECFEGKDATMSFLDVIEMVCDWWGAGKGYDDPRAWMDSVKLNIENKGKYLSPEQLWLVNEVAAFIGKELEK